MGAINHQPCNRYLADSTELSKSLSEGRLHLEAANVNIENILLDELRERPLDHTHVAGAIEELTQSVAALGNMNGCLDRIQARLIESADWEPPTVATIDWHTVGDELIGVGAVDRRAWSEMTSQRCQGGFGSIIAHFRKEIASLSDDSLLLAAEMEILRPAIMKRNFENSVENNLAGNFKLGFAKLYNRWSCFQQDFLASAMMSTESWYSWVGCGTLTKAASNGRQAA